MIDFSLFLNEALLIKGLLLLFVGGYSVFAFVMLNQVRVMNNIIAYEGVSNIVSLVALLHLLVAISLFFAILVIL